MALDPEKLASLPAATQKRLKNLDLIAEKRNLTISISDDSKKVRFNNKETGKFICSSPMSDFT